jgi:hypothetical protein
MADIAPGHNHPPFDPVEIVNLKILADQLRDTYDHLFKEQRALLAAFANWKAAHAKGILDDEDQGNATEQVAQLMTALDAFHGKPGSVHTVAKEPFLHGGRIVDGVLNGELAAPLRQAIMEMKTVMKAYADERHRRLMEAAQKAAAETAAAARKAALEAAGDEPGDPMAALEAEQAAMDAAAQTAAPIGPQSQIRGDLGGMSSLRGKWKVRITDPDKIPRHYMMPNFAVLEGIMNSSKDKKTGVPSAQVAGCEWYLDTSLSIRK